MWKELESFSHFNRWHNDPLVQLRDSNFFKDAIFLHDRLHQANHKACSHVFRLNDFRSSLDKELINLNDSAAEVGNAGLAKMKTSLRYMKKETFMHMFRLQLELQNMKRIIRLRRAMSARKLASS